jgi:hypothetical protein
VNWRGGDGECQTAHEYEAMALEMLAATDRLLESKHYDAKIIASCERRTQVYATLALALAAAAEYVGWLLANGSTTPSTPPSPATP